MATSWILVPCLVKLKSEFNAIAPNRDKSSDGSVGDLAHQNSQSDHNPDETGNVPIRDADKVNEVHAIDVDVDLRVPGLSMENVVQFLLTRCRSGAEKRLRYIIYNRRIWSASNGWVRKTYTGKNAHDHHAHFSSSYESPREADTSDWGLEEEFMAVDYDKIRTIVREEVAKAVTTVIDNVPTADENGKASLTALRQSPTTGMSDTGANLIVSQVTKAVAAGQVVEPYPANKDKSLGNVK